MNRRNLVLLLFGQAISRLGDSIQIVALFWLVYKLTGSEEVTSMIALAGVLPTVLFGFIAGAMVDRYNKRKIIIVSDFIQSVLYISLVGIYYVGRLTMPVLAIFIFLIGMSRTLFYPSLRAIIPNMFDEESLTKVNSLNSIATQSASMIGPALAGVLIYYIGNMSLFVLNSITFIISGITIICLSLQIDGNSYSESNNKSRIWDDIIEGFKYVYQQKRVLFLILSFPTFTIVAAGLTDIALLPFVEQFMNGTAIEYGLLQTFISVGTLIGGTVLVFFKGKDKMWLYIYTIFFVGLIFFTFGLNLHYFVAFVLMLLLGCTFTFLEVFMVTTIQVQVDSSMHGRVFNLWSVLGTAGDAISYILISGFFVVFSVKGTFVLGGIMLMFAAVVGVVIVKLSAMKN